MFLTAVIYGIEQWRVRRPAFLEQVWLSVIVASFALLMLVLTVHFSPAFAKDNNPFSGAISITVTMHRVHHARSRCLRISHCCSPRHGGSFIRVEPLDGVFGQASASELLLSRSFQNYHPRQIDIDLALLIRRGW